MWKCDITRTSRSCLACVCLFVSLGCGDGSEAVTRSDAGVEVGEELDECLVGVWRSGTRDCRCDIEALRTPECAESDCQRLFPIILAQDGSYTEFEMRYSESSSTTSVVGGAISARGSWSVSSGDGQSQLTRVLRMETRTRPVSCSQERLEWGTVSYGRASERESQIAVALDGSSGELVAVPLP